MSYSDGHAVCTSDVGVVRHADLVETRLGEVGGEGGGLLSLSLLHVVEVALAHEGRGVHGMLPLPDQFGFYVVYYNAGKRRGIGLDEANHLWLVHLTGFGKSGVAVADKRLCKAACDKWDNKAKVSWLDHHVVFYELK